jgi:hypothetical protein
MTTATLTKPARKPVLHIEALAAKLAAARYERRRWEEEEARIAALLIEAHDAGVAPTKFTISGWSFLLQAGRQTVQYPEATLAQIKDLQAAAVAAGTTTTKQGAPFWRVTAIKEEA